MLVLTCDSAGLAAVLQCRVGNIPLDARSQALDYPPIGGWTAVRRRDAASQVELDQEFALCFVLRDGKLARIQSFIGWQQALEAAGLTD
jgi:hypothetical protein